MAEELIVISLASLVALVIGVLIGMFMNPLFRAKTLRSLTKKEYGILALVSKDKRSSRLFVVNFNEFVLAVAGKKWAGVGGRIYREDAPEKGFYTNDKMVKYREGVPIVYVDDESLTPLEFWSDAGKVSPDEVGSVYTAWVNNQIAKGQARGQQNLQLFLIIAILAAVGAAYFGYQTNAKAEALQAQVSSDHVILVKMSTYFGLDQAKTLQDAGYAITPDVVPNK
jgi:hypothetical protein